MIGLGRAQRASSMEVYWPTTGTVQVFRDPPLDTLVEIREGEDELRTRELRRFSFKTI